MAESWLILELSGRAGRVGLACNGAIVRSVELDDARRHARDLTATIARILQEASLKPMDLKGAMVGRGPGSYTGLRVGLMTAKALAYSTGCQLIAVDSFAAIALQTPPEAEKLWVIADALQKQIYVQRFARNASGSWFAADELRIDRAEDWLSRTAPGTWVSGPGVKLYEEHIPLNYPRVAEANREARIESVYAVGMEISPLSREELFALEPLYLRGSSAEEKAKAVGKR
jgi:tRNA threonylcarbamoyladenosine biosynthesis protein TsaB